MHKFAKKFFTTNEYYRLVATVSDLNEQSEIVKYLIYIIEIQ